MFGNFTKFSHIKKMFKKCNKINHVTMWNIQINGLTLFLNDRNNDLMVLRINTYNELENKIKDKLKLMGYINVDEIPKDILITYV
jgi:hypothetical protein